MRGLTFDEARHEYRLDGVKLPGVTTVLKPISSAHYAGVDPDVMARAAALGQAVHKVIELDLQQDLDTDSLDPELVPYYRGWRMFLRQSGFQAYLSEKKLASVQGRYAGTLDLMGVLNGLPSLIDAKRVAVVTPSTGPQTFAYGQLVRENCPELLGPTTPLRRYALQLKKAVPNAVTADWQLLPFTNDSRDRLVWQSCLNIAHYLQESKT
ncbi:MAG: hypothetical protein E6R07_14645 [Nevskiaceae bacterium]|nr:MAG: hypothetical protein E6R07_14645 [Nevskiaceae bacterium]